MWGITNRRHVWSSFHSRYQRFSSHPRIRNQQIQSIKIESVEDCELVFCSEFWVLRSEFWVLRSEFCVQSFEFRVLSSEFWVLSSEFSNPRSVPTVLPEGNSVDSELKVNGRVLSSGFRVLGLKLCEAKQTPTSYFLCPRSSLLILPKTERRLSPPSGREPNLWNKPTVYKLIIHHYQ